MHRLQTSRQLWRAYSKFESPVPGTVNVSLVTSSLKTPADWRRRNGGPCSHIVFKHDSTLDRPTGSTFASAVSNVTVIIGRAALELQRKHKHQQRLECVFNEAVNMRTFLIISADSFDYSNVVVCFVLFFCFFTRRS